MLDGSSKCGNFDVTKDYFLCGYVGQPEYNKEELKLMEFSDDTKTKIDEEKSFISVNAHIAMLCQLLSSLLLR